MTDQVTIQSFALYAEQRIELGHGNQVVGGDTGVRSRAKESVDSQLNIAGRSRVSEDHRAIAPSVTIGDDVEHGEILADVLIDHGIPLRSPHRFPAAAMPALPLAAAASGGSQDVTIGEGEVSALAPGRYGNLTVHGSLVLSHGEYLFATVTIGNRATLASAGTVLVRVAGYLSAGRGARLHPLFGQQAGQFRILVAGTDPAASLPTVSIGEHGEIRALLAASHGTVAVADHARLAGAVAGYVIVTGEDVTVRHEDGFPEQVSGDHGSQQLGATYGVPAGPDTLPVAGPVPSDAAVSLAIGLPIRDNDGLQALIASVSDPKSARFRQYLSPDAFTATYGATAEDYQRLQEWAGSAGLSTLATFPNRLLLSVSGTAAQVQEALFVNLVYRQRADGSLFVAADRHPSLNLSVPVLEVNGLGDAVLPVHRNLNGTGGGGSYRAADLRNAYLGVDSPLQALDGSGQNVGVFGFGPFSGSDVTGYRMNQKPASGEDSPLPVVDVVLVEVTSGAGAGALDEANLDVEMVYAMAPKATIYFMTGGAGGSDAAAAILHGMATFTPQLTVVSNSWSWAGDTGNAQQALDQLAIQGVSFFTASGDEGVSSEIWQNLTMNHQTLVGGTVLSTNPLGPGNSYPDPYYAGEGAWPSSGGGTLDVPIPDYQLAIMQADAATNGGSTTARNFPDVAMPAQDIEFFTSGATAVGAGTSFATPLWAGFTALINQMSAQNNAGLMGFLNPTLYDIGLTQADTGNANLYAPCFNDIDDGTSNGQFKAVSGYDLVTGLGSPKPGLISQLASATPTTPAEFQVIRFIIATGGDDLRDDSTATADVLLKNGGVFTVTLKEKGDRGWGNGTTQGPLDFPIPGTVTLPTPTEGLSGIRINLIQGGSFPETDDNWDISTLQVSLVNPGHPAFCQLNLVGNNQLQDGSTGLVRLSGSAGSSGVGPSSPIFATGPASGC